MISLAPAVAAVANAKRRTCRRLPAWCGGGGPSCVYHRADPEIVLCAFGGEWTPAGRSQAGKRGRGVLAVGSGREAAIVRLSMAVELVWWGLVGWACGESVCPSPANSQYLLLYYHIVANIYLVSSYESIGWSCGGTAPRMDSMKHSARMRPHAFMSFQMDSRLL